MSYIRPLVFEDPLESETRNDISILENLGDESFLYDIFYDSRIGGVCHHYAFNGFNVGIYFRSNGVIWTNAVCFFDRNYYYLGMNADGTLNTSPVSRYGIPSRLHLTLLVDGDPVEFFQNQNCTVHFLPGSYNLDFLKNYTEETDLDLEEEDRVSAEKKLQSSLLAYFLNIAEYFGGVIDGQDVSDSDNLTEF